MDYMVRFLPERERFEASFIPCPMSGCWLWAGKHDANGYGTFSINSKRTLAHRYAASIYIGKEIPPGMIVCHKCDNRMCVNPDHLYIGTASDNLKDAHDRKRRGVYVAGWNKGHRVDACKRGHPRAIYGRNPPSGKSYCIECCRVRRMEKK